uniref:Retrotransposon protein, putative, Ty1-copia subclass n=1 Tax=Oryza sativa subsp. japonica TaxID=39947 RepID=Q2QU85_ORYSJ|nr:retrotransposon protein, putative, Ty1-copia subclass [Oryza sativa Japonica Group]
MGNGNECMAEAGTACSGGSDVATSWRRCKERRLPRARRHGSGSGEVLRQPEAEEEVRQGQAGEPQLELQSHGGEGSGGGHNPSPASAGSPTRPPHRSTKKIAKLACALMAREAENGIHDPMKDQKVMFFLLKLRELLRESESADNMEKGWQPETRWLGTIASVAKKRLGKRHGCLRLRSILLYG